MIPLTLSTGSLYTYGTARVFELAARAGYDGLELMVDGHQDTHQADYLRGLMDRYDLPILSVHSPFSSLRIVGWPDGEVARVERSVALAEALDARVVNLHLPLRIRDLVITFARHGLRVPIPGPSDDQRRYWEWLAEGGLATLQTKTQVEIVIENLPMRMFLGRRFSTAAMNTWAELAAFPQVCLDTTHCGTTGSDLVAVQEMLADRISHVHLSDYATGRQHLAVEHGALPLGQFLKALATRNYAGIIVVELAPRALPVHDEEELAAELRRNLAFCRQQLSQGSPGSTVAGD